MSISGKRFDLSRLIAPIGVAAFQREYWEQRPLVIRRDDRGYYGDLFSLDSVDEIISTSSPQSPTIRAVKNGLESPVERSAPSDKAGLSVEHIYNEYRNGSTLVLAHVHERWPALQNLCANLAAECSTGFQVNAYLTPRAAQGLGVHYDTHDVFVLQIEGRKSWRVFDSPLRLPLPSQPYKKETAASAEPTLELTMHAGDLLYLPRGVVHEAHSEDEFSLHLTLGVLPATWADVILVAVETAIEQNAVFREALPFGFAIGNSRDQEMERQLRVLMNVISHDANCQAAIANARAMARLAKPPLMRGHLHDLNVEMRITLETPLTMRDGLQWWLETRGDEVCLLFHGKEVCMPSHVEDDLRFIGAAKGPFTGAQLPGRLDDTGRLTLVRRLLKEGLLTASGPASAAISSATAQIPISGSARRIHR